MSEMHFWPVKFRKKLKLPRCIQVFDLVLKWCSEKNEGNWIQFFFYFLQLEKVVPLFIALIVFHVWFLFRVDVFSYFNVTETFATGQQNKIDHEWGKYLVFCWIELRFDEFISTWTKMYKN